MQSYDNYGHRDVGIFYDAHAYFHQSHFGYNYA